MTAGCPAVVVGGAEGFGAGSTGYFAEHFAAGAAGADDAGNSVVGVGVCFGTAFLEGFVNFHPSPPLHVLLHYYKWGNVVPMCKSLHLVWGWTIALGIAAT